MTRYVALLRGVNVGGKAKVPMSDLRAVFESLAFGDVTTYIQSGNVVFTAPRTPTPATIEGAVSSRFGFDAQVVIRSAGALTAVVDANPFPGVEADKLHVGFMASAATSEVASALDGSSCVPERFVVSHTEVYLHLPAGMGRAKLPAYLDRHLKVPTTYRNWATVTKLIDLVRDGE